MDERQKQILKFAQLAIKECQGQEVFTQKDKEEMATLETQLSMPKREILAQATILLLK
jgi:hypothetical protein